MLILIAGGLLAALGLGSAVVLVGGPLGLVAATPGLLPWVLFPLFTLVGYLLLVVGSDDAAARVPTRVLSALLRTTPLPNLRALGLSKAVIRPLARSRLAAKVFAPFPLEAALLNLIDRTS